MKLFQKSPNVEEWKRRVDHGEAIANMTRTEGWKILSELFTEQLEAYKAELLLGCKDWNEYQEKRGKAFAMRLLFTDVEDYIRQGEEAKEELENYNA